MRMSLKQPFRYHTLFGRELIVTRKETYFGQAITVPRFVAHTKNFEANCLTPVFSFVYIGKSSGPYKVTTVFHPCKLIALWEDLT